MTSVFKNNKQLFFSDLVNYPFMSSFMLILSHRLSHSNHVIDSYLTKQLSKLSAKSP